MQGSQLACAFAATVQSGALEAGGTFGPTPRGPVVTLDGNTPVSFRAGMFQVVGKAPNDLANGSIQAMFCGAMASNVLIDEIKTAPASLFAQAGFSKAQVIGFMLEIYAPDLDLDGDGVAESTSFAFTFSAEVVPQITGLY